MLEPSLCLNPEALRTGNRVELLRDGAQAYPRMLEAIRGAQESILLVTYIFEEDATGKRFAEALIERARAGVRVHVSYDAIGSLSTSTEFFDALRASNVRVAEFNPLREFLRGFRYRRRDHRKLLVVDGRIAFAGGLNIGKEYDDPAAGGLGWRDTHLSFEGPIVEDLAACYPSFLIPCRKVEYEGGVRVRILSSHRFRERWQIVRVYRHAIRHAHRRVWIANPYFIPSRRFRNELGKAARRGVDVRLLLPGKTDVAPVLYAAQHHYAGYLRVGIRIFEWTGTMMHAKTALIDGEWSTVGSYNIDHMSLLQNYELTAFIMDAPFAAKLETMFEQDFARSREVLKEEWARRGLWRRLLEAFFYLFHLFF